jgi:ADP-ribose pyrophosphatase YjhB (NUDIX family)
VTVHCRACGAALPDRPPATCPACGTRDWANAKPCAAALVVREGHVLLTRRALAPWRGLWCAPAGFCDGPEHPILAAEREVREETGLDARVVGYLGTWICPYADAPDDAREHVSVHYYAAELHADGGPGRPDPAEVTELRWFDLSNLPEGLAPETVLPAALDALRAALAGQGLQTPLPDRPSPA